MKPVALRYGKEIRLVLEDEETGARVFVGAALNLPDAKLAARGKLTTLLYALDRVGVKDIQEEP